MLVASLGEALTRSHGVDDAAAQCARVLAAHLDAELAAVWTRPVKNDAPRSDALVLVARAGRDPTLEAPAALVNEASAMRVAVRHEPFYVVPLVVEEDLIGVIGVHSRHPDTSASVSTITGLVALGLARARAEGDAESATRSKDEFLSVVSHELRTPLNAITGWAALLKEGSLDAVRAKRAIDTIERNGRAQAQLIDNLLDVTRIASGKLRLDRGRLDLASIVRMALESARIAAETKGIDVESAIASDLPALVGDADRVQQIVWNLLTNAIKFTPSGGVVRVAVDAVGDVLEIRVTDSGQGISPEFLPYVFDRFRQADPSTTRSTGGLGLGLSIARHLVELHGGTIEAQSEGRGRGATFRVSLPVPAGRDARLGAGGTGRHPALGSRSELQGVHVLIVDDEADTRELLKTLLELHGIVVTTCSSAADAYEVIRTTKPDVVLSDVGMPVEDGLSFMRRVRRLPDNEGGSVPAVALTAYARAEDRTSALDAGYNTHLAKPLNTTELVAVLTNLVARR